MNPPTLLDELVANQAFWGVLLFAAFAGVIYYTTEFLKAWHAESAKLDRVLEQGPPDDLWCEINGHAYNADPNGWHCANCTQIVRFPQTCAFAVPPDVCAVCVQRRTCDVYDGQSS